VEQGEKFLCWYCRASRVASAAQAMIDILDTEHDAVELILAADLLKAELGEFHYSRITLKELKKPIKGLEDVG